MRRREAIAGLGFALGAPIAAMAQQRGRVPRIGFLGNSNPGLEAHLVRPFREGLRDLGYVEGENIIIEYRWAEGKYDRFPLLVAELVVSNVGLIVTAGTPAALAVINTAPALPLVMVAVGDPVGTGLVASLARPGGNATGLTSLAPDLEGKRLELIREMLPAVSRLAVFWNPANEYQIRSEKEVQSAAALLGMPVHSLPVHSAEELDRAFAEAIGTRADAILVLADRVFLHNRDRIVSFASKNRVPCVSAYRELVEAGGLMSFGPSYSVMHRQAARYVDKIMKGTNPAELPVEQPAKFEFVLNTRTAKDLGITVPATLLARADEVIE